MRAGFCLWKMQGEKSSKGDSITTGRDHMVRWVICRRLNLLKHKWQNKWKSLLIFVPKIWVHLKNREISHLQWYINRVKVMHANVVP